MKLATHDDGTSDGRLVVISPDGSRFFNASEVAATMQAALDNWAAAEPVLRKLAERLAEGEGESAHGLHFAAPLPRAWAMARWFRLPQPWRVDGNIVRHRTTPAGTPLDVSGMSHQFLSATADVPLPREEDGIDSRVSSAS